MIENQEGKDEERWKGEHTNGRTGVSWAKQGPGQYRLGYHPVRSRPAI
jgi:hypothetical protein